MVEREEYTRRNQVQETGSTKEASPDLRDTLNQIKNNTIERSQNDGADQMKSGNKLPSSIAQGQDIGITQETYPDLRVTLNERQTKLPSPEAQDDLRVNLNKMSKSPRRT